MGKSKILLEIETSSPINLSEFLERFPPSERKAVEMEVFNLVGEGEIGIERIFPGNGNSDYILKRIGSDNQLTFDGLRLFLTEKIRPQHIYQPIIIRKLLESGGKATKSGIVEEISLHTKQDPKEHLQNEGFRVLSEHGIIEIKDGIVVLKVNQSLEDFRNKTLDYLELIALCNKIIYSFIESKQSPNYFIAVGDWNNWQYNVKNLSPFSWGVDSTNLGAYNKAEPGDIVCYYVTKKVNSPFTDTCIFGAGIIKKKYSNGTETQLQDKIIFANRLEIDTIFIANKNKDAIPWIEGLPNQSGLNIVANVENIKKLSDAIKQKTRIELENQNCWMLKFSPTSSYDEKLGDHYELPDGIPNARNIAQGDRTIWFEVSNDRINLWGFGDVVRVDDKNGKKYAFFENFRYFGEKGMRLEKPMSEEKALYRLPEILEDAIKNSGKWNPRNAIISLVPENYKMLIGKGDVFQDHTLSIPKEDEVRKMIKEKILDEILVEEDKVMEIVNHIASGRHVLLAGPVGTGKTRLAMKIPSLFKSQDDDGFLVEEHTATSEWTTFDVIGGIIPKMDESRAVYDVHYGCVVDTVRKNWEHDIDGGLRTQNILDGKIYRGVWLVIDEFNRADIDKAFGQLFTSLRSRKLKIPTKFPGKHYKELTIPKDFRIFGTLNTVDKNFLFDLSDALKSRFAFVEIGLPRDDDFDKEIFYAINNAKEELEKEFSFLKLNIEKKSIDIDSTDGEFYKALLQTYFFLRTIRRFKKLGTAILKLLYQDMIVRREISGKNDSLIAPSIISIILPQLETLTGNEIKTISILHSSDFKDRLSKLYESKDRASYTSSIKAIFSLLGLGGEYSDAFAKHTLTVENFGTIEKTHKEKEAQFFALPIKLENAMKELSESSII